MKRLAVSFALTCVLSCSAMAVDMPTCGITAQEPPIIETEGSIPTADVTNPTNPVAVELILTLLGIVAY